MFWVLILDNLYVIPDFLANFITWKSFSSLSAIQETWAELLWHVANQDSWFQLGLFQFIIITAIISQVPNMDQGDR